MNDAFLLLDPRCLTAFTKSKDFARLYYVADIKKVAGNWVVVCPYNKLKYA
jgi:hypothetical protein